MSVDVKKMIATVKASKDYIDYVKYHENNIFSITKVSRWELMHSNFLAWLLNPSDTHSLGFFPIVQFMQMLCNMNLTNYPSSHTVDVFCSNHNIRNVEIIREQPAPVVDEFGNPKLGKKGKQISKKIDIVIKIEYEDGVLPIIIENKVGSPENGEDSDQTIIYHSWGEANFPSGFKPIYLCLVPLFNKVEPKCKDFSVIDYQQLVYHVIEPCLWKTNNTWTHDTINMYLQCLSYQTDNKKGHNTMAISTEERQILNDFLDNNDTFINSLLDIFSEGATEEEKVAIAKVRKTAKDFSSYEFNGATYNKTHLASAVIQKAIQDGKIKDYSSLESNFKKIGKKNYIIRSKMDMKDITRYDIYPEFSLNGVDFGVSNQWDKPSIEDFIQEAINKFGYTIAVV